MQRNEDFIHLSWTDLILPSCLFSVQNNKKPEMNSGFFIMHLASFG